MEGLEDITVEDGDRVDPRLIDRALTAGRLHYPDGSTQQFGTGGETTYVENGRATLGSWRVFEDGIFSSFWPPGYTARYELRWIVEDGVVAGVSFVELQQGSRFDGRYDQSAQPRQNG